MSATATRTRVVRNSDANWNKFSPHDYFAKNYGELQAEDQEIIRQVSDFFIRAFAGRPHAKHGVDIGSGTNLYPALLMLPWTEQILLTDYSTRNIRWLRHQLADENTPWDWGLFWNELQAAEGYNRIGEPRKQLRAACVSEPGCGGVERRSVFGLPKEQWDLGTMFFVAESITESPGEFRTALARFVGALKPGSPFATAFMAGSDGYPVADTVFPALPITPDDVRQHFTELGASDLAVTKLRTEDRVRPGYHAMIVATGFTFKR